MNGSWTRRSFLSKVAVSAAWITSGATTGLTTGCGGGSTAGSNGSGGTEDSKPGFREVPGFSELSDAELVGISSDGSRIAMRAGNDGFLWSESEGYTRFPGRIKCFSPDGNYVGGQHTSQNLDRPFIWSQSGDLLYVGIGKIGLCEDISSNASVVLGTFILPGGAQGFVLRKDGVIQARTYLPKFVSDDGSIIFGESVVPRPEGVDGRVLVRESPDGMDLLGAFGKSSNTSITGIASDGRSCVGSSELGGFRWTLSDGYQNLDDDPATGWVRAKGISPDGSIVFGSYELADSGVWREAHGWKPLIDFLKEFQLGDSPAKWTQLGIVGCSADNKTFLGYGTNPSGQVSAWIART